MAGKKRLYVTIGFKGDAGLQDAILSRAENLTDIVRKNNVRMPDGRRNFSWIPAMFRPDAGIPPAEAFLEDYGSLESTIDCEVRLLPEDMAGGIYIVAYGDEDGITAMARKISGLLGIRLYTVTELNPDINVPREVVPDGRTAPDPMKLLANLSGKEA